MAREAAEREGRTYWGMSARACDSCRSAPALLFCRADSAFLCGPCDAKVHGANKLASRHERVWMCEVCEQAPAAVTCKADAAALCVSCDADIHSANPLARRHDRVPVQPFFDFLPNPPPAHLKAEAEEEDGGGDSEEDGDETVWPAEDHTKPSMMENLFSDVDPYLDLDASFPHMDSVVPVQNHTGVAIHQVPRHMFAVSEHVDFEGAKGSYAFTPSLSHSISSSDVGVVPDAGTMGEISKPYVTGVPVNPMAMMGHMVAAAAVVGMDREARVMRYREKRKNRKFEKTIRYASRKAYAETRPRIKGRFAKRPEMDDIGYGVVPTF